MTERKPPGMSFETWVDQQLAQARARGAFDDLDGAGRPLPRREREQGS
ncbi:DnaJ family domain-containing protein [Geodermatophilus sp. CPCC 205761]